MTMEKTQMPYATPPVDVKASKGLVGIREQIDNFIAKQREGVFYNYDIAAVESAAIEFTNDPDDDVTPSLIVLSVIEVIRRQGSPNELVLDSMPEKLLYSLNCIVCSVIKETDSSDIDSIEQIDQGIVEQIADAAFNRMKAEPDIVPVDLINNEISICNLLFNTDIAETPINLASSFAECPSYIGYKRPKLVDMLSIDGDYPSLNAHWAVIGELPIVVKVNKKGTMSFTAMLLNHKDGFHKERLDKETAFAIVNSGFAYFADCFYEDIISSKRCNGIKRTWRKNVVAVADKSAINDDAVRLVKIQPLSRRTNFIELAQKSLDKIIFLMPAWHSSGRCEGAIIIDDLGVSYSVDGEIFHDTADNINALNFKTPSQLAYCEMEARYPVKLSSFSGARSEEQSASSDNMPSDSADKHGNEKTVEQKAFRFRVGLTKTGLSFFRQAHEWLDAEIRVPQKDVVAAIKEGTVTFVDGWRRNISYHVFINREQIPYRLAIFQGTLSSDEEKHIVDTAKKHQNVAHSYMGETILDSDLRLERFYPVTSASREILEKALANCDIGVSLPRTAQFYMNRDGRLTLDTPSTLAYKMFNLPDPAAHTDSSKPTAPTTVKALEPPTVDTPQTAATIDKAFDIADLPHVNFYAEPIKPLAIEPAINLFTRKTSDEQSAPSTSTNAVNNLDADNVDAANNTASTADAVDDATERFDVVKLFAPPTVLLLPAPKLHIEFINPVMTFKPSIIPMKQMPAEPPIETIDAAPNADPVGGVTAEFLAPKIQRFDSTISSAKSKITLRLVAAKTAALELQNIRRERVIKENLTSIEIVYPPRSTRMIDAEIVLDDTAPDDNINSNASDTPNKAPSTVDTANDTATPPDVSNDVVALVSPPPILTLSHERKKRIAKSAPITDQASVKESLTDKGALAADIILQSLKLGLIATLTVFANINQSAPMVAVAEAVSFVFVVETIIKIVLLFLSNANTCDGMLDGAKDFTSHNRRPRRQLYNPITRAQARKSAKAIRAPEPLS